MRHIYKLFIFISYKY